MNIRNLVLTLLRIERLFNKIKADALVYTYVVTINKTCFLLCTPFGVFKLFLSILKWLHANFNFDTAIISSYLNRFVINKCTLMRPWLFVL